MNKHPNEIDRNGDGVVRLYSGALVDVRNPDPDTLNIFDVAWGLGRTLRYNGHLKQDYTVAHHSLIMSYYVPREFAMEALLHDAGEAYFGDIVHPIKELYPEIALDENMLTAAIMRKFSDYDGECYQRSLPVARADAVIYAHECFSFGDRPGTYSQQMQDAWQQAIEESDALWHAPMYPFMFRYHELKGTGVKNSTLIEYLTPIWYPDGVIEYEGLSEEQSEQVATILEEL